MTIKRDLDAFGQRPCGGTARRQIGRPLPAVPRGGNKNLYNFWHNRSVYKVPNRSYYSNQVSLCGPCM